MEWAYYFVDGVWNVPTTLTFVGRVRLVGGHRDVIDIDFCIG